MNAGEEGKQRGQLLEGGALIDGDKLQMSLKWASGLASTCCTCLPY